eukprot:SAG31_NODE_16189_length_719_cov_1.329032_1_plen_100_part_10
MRDVLEDPAYSGFFLSYDPSRKGNYTNNPCDVHYKPAKCSSLFHDIEQVPDGVGSHPGKCKAACDCGKLPCGRYLYDHRNATARAWIINELLLGKTGLGS